MSHKEVLAIAEAVANEKEIPKAAVFEALETALAAATKKRFEEEVAIRVSIDQRSGEYTTYRQWFIVDDDDFLERPQAQMREMVAAVEFPKANLQAGDVHEIIIENEPFGRISAQLAKQIIIQKIKEAEREKIYLQFAHMEGTLVNGIVRRYEKGTVLVDVDGMEASISREHLIPRENLRIGDRVRCYLEKVNRDVRGQLLLLSRTSPELLKQLFKVEVPEIGAGNIEIMGAARDPGRRAKIAVKTLDPRIDPVGACVGIRGSRVQSVTNELNGERIDIVLWNDDPSEYLCNAMAPAQIIQTISEEEKKKIEIIVPDDRYAQAVGREGQNVKLASQLTGWTITVTPQQLFLQRQSQEQSGLQHFLGIDDELMEQLRENDLASAEALAEADDELLTEIAGDRAEVLRDRALDYQLQQNLDVEGEELENLIVGLFPRDSAQIIGALKNEGLNSLAQLADLSTAELMDISTMNQRDAAALIMKAREQQEQDKGDE